MRSVLLFLVIILSFPATAQWTTGSGLIHFNGGSVGIGTALPTSKLHVFDGDIRIQANGANGINRALIFDAPSSVNLASLISMRRDNLPRWQFGASGGSGTDNLDFFRYDNAGAILGAALRLERATGNAIFSSAIGIGTGVSSLGTLKLAVEGKAAAREFMVLPNATAWPDFVFESQYKLPALSDIKSFVAINKHLPGIPSKDEVEKGGHELGKMDALLLQKVEELTLYVIQLKEENDKLQERIEGLERNK